MENSTMNFKQLHKALVFRILDGEGTASKSERKAAFDKSANSNQLKNLIDKISDFSFKITDEDFDEVIKSGFNEDQIFELVICAAVGQATRQYDIAYSALNQALKMEKGKGDAS